MVFGFDRGAVSGGEIVLCKGGAGKPKGWCEAFALRILKAERIQELLSSPVWDEALLPVLTEEKRTMLYNRSIIAEGD